MVRYLKAINWALLICSLFLIPSYVLANEGDANTTTQNCPNGPFIAAPETGQTIQGVHILKAYLPSGSSSVEYVRFVSNGAVLGTASQQQGALWEMNWDTTLVDNGEKTVRAVAKYQNDAICTGQEITVAVNNQSQPAQQPQVTLNASVNRSQWVGPTNVSYLFKFSAQTQQGGAKNNVTDQAAYNYTTTIGSLKQEGSALRFFSGSRSGGGTITATVEYSGQQRKITIPVTVFANNSSSNDYPSTAASKDTSLNSDSTNTSSTQTDGTTSETTDATQPVTARGDDVLETCLLETLQSERYKSLTEKNQRLAFAELSRNLGCFSQRKFVVPANLAPVAPEQIESLDELESLSVTTVDSVEVIDEDTITDGLTFSGTAEPNKPVLIYIFSEPLVLATVSDGDGNWSYTLEEPLEPGDHEVYIAVEDEAGIARKSAPFFIEIAAAESSEQNPVGASLDLVVDDASSSRDISFIAIATLLVILSFGFLTGYIIAHQKHKPKNVDGLQGQT
ncbi:TPA: hypothetical protein EYO12_01170 [Candidatus Saccharibacteria bacterium]|nr:hypothetical protein [Candidatus Saccharibacteria bacterium]HIO87329.1 hypothetical protein [Candidatus Saccharibacteria bacterium]